MKLEKEIPMLDARRRPVSDYKLAILGTMHYPDCPYSIHHFRRIMGEDADVAEGFESELAQTVSTANIQAKRKGDAAGRVALKLMALHVDDDLEVSLTKACYLTAESVSLLTIEDGKPYSPKNPDSIRKCFYEKKNACHLWAASVAHREIFLRVAEDDAALREFLGLAAIFSGILDKAFGVNPDLGKWDPWIVPNEYCDGRINLHVPKEIYWLREELAKLGNTYRGGY